MLRSKIVHDYFYFDGSYESFLELRKKFNDNIDNCVYNPGSYSIGVKTTTHVKGSYIVCSRYGCRISRWKIVNSYKSFEELLKDYEEVKNEN